MTHRSCVRTNLTYHTKIIIFLQIPKIKTKGSKPRAAKPYSNPTAAKLPVSHSGRSLETDISSRSSIFLHFYLRISNIILNFAAILKPINCIYNLFIYNLIIYEKTGPQTSSRPWPQPLL